MKSFSLMLAFFTRIPVRTTGEIDETMYKKGIKYLPVVSLIIGIPVGIVMWLSQWVGAYVAAFIALCVYLLLSGGLHIDGMADTIDGFSAHRDRESTLRIMKDSHIGTFGVLAVCVYVVGMIICMAQAVFVVAVFFPLAGRTTALLCARMNRSATDGLGRWFVDGVTTAHVMIAAVLFMAVSSLSLLFEAWPVFAWLIVSFGMAVLVTVVTVKRLAKKLDGVTGDVIGFSIELSQLIFLLFSSFTAIIL